MQYLFTVTETLRKSVLIEAESETDAYEKGVELYNEAEIVLYADDFVEVNFETAPERKEIEE